MTGRGVLPEPSALDAAIRQRAEVFGLRRSGLRGTPCRQHLSDLCRTEILVRHVLKNRLEDRVHPLIGFDHRHVKIQILTPLEMGKAVHILDQKICRREIHRLVVSVEAREDHTAGKQFDLTEERVFVGLRQVVVRLLSRSHICKKLTVSSTMAFEVSWPWKTPDISHSRPHRLPECIASRISLVSNSVFADLLLVDYIRKHQED